MDDHQLQYQPPLEDSAAKTSKLCIKIKIPNNTTYTTRKPGGEGGGVEGVSGSGDLQGQPAGYRVCEYCGKTFSSGKAWGGHKRHHLKLMKNNNGKETQEASNIEMKKHKHGGSNRCNTIKAGDVTISGGKPICCLCGKTFLSTNSLFGHMRYHPDRDWKGIRPPPPPPLFPKNQIISSALEKVSDSSIDLLDSLSGGWQKKGKRGTCASDLIPEAAYSLLTLSRYFCLSTPPAYVGGHGLETSGSSTKSLGRAIMAETGSRSDHRSKEDEDSDEICGLVTKKKRRKMNYISKLRNSETEPCEFKCSTCDKSFPTFHALRSHRSSFNCKKRSNELASGSAMVDDDASAAEEIPASEPDDETEETREDDPCPVMSIETSFHCDICEKTFPTGQALGGHKRCHRRAPAKPLSNEAVSAEASYVASNTASSGEAEGIQAGHGVIGFDLNKPYVMQDGEENLLS
ncbi:hypothetical protein P3X46_015573 [Hevea brasiliensis]|uniref:C2H2-type domain-containing protein n=1 Tax=Hevea brasiliensis TaxID=3981 RepID=A0ABQ9LWD2_HEVBR|nr:uncharacterized protein LOC110653220 [Hevea brasiliensis]KAJ9172324.1 hypothetical protein P3X46_015573 [Hevea brasiliensis]